MKNVLKSFGIIAVAAVIMFGVAACDDGDDDGASSAPLGATMTLSGQVYTDNWETGEFNAITVNGEVSGHLNGDIYGPPIVGNGTITAGQLSITIDTPSLDDLYEIGDGWIFDIDNLTIDSPTARIASLDLGVASASAGSGAVYLQRYTYNNNTLESVRYYFVDRDVHISADRIEDDWYVTNAVNINLKAGWNAIHYKEVWTETSNTKTISAANPRNLRWVVDL